MLWIAMFLLCIESFWFLRHNRLTSGKLLIFLCYYSSEYVTFKCLVLEIAVQVADFLQKKKSFNELCFRIRTNFPTVSKMILQYFCYFVLCIYEAALSELIKKSYSTLKNNGDSENQAVSDIQLRINNLCNNQRHSSHDYASLLSSISDSHMYIN